MSGLTQAAIAEAYVDACRAELQALKPGNVHVHADDGESLSDLQASADASAGPLTQPGAAVGRRIRAAIEATRSRVTWNTNLGIVLLCAPIAAAAENAGDLRSALAGILDRLDVGDAREAFAAIALARPGGLGRAPSHDVADPARVTLGEAMRAAADRDRIARAYANGFADLFAIGLPALRAARTSGLDRPWSVAALYMAFLADEPDSHIVRKFGAAAAEAVRRQAADLLTAGVTPSAAGRLLAFDAQLKRQGLNPGTSADFAVATTFLDNILCAESAES